MMKTILLLGVFVLVYKKITKFVGWVSSLRNQKIDIFINAENKG
jgi:hypothetical protein